MLGVTLFVRLSIWAPEDTQVVHYTFQCVTVYNFMMKKKKKNSKKNQKKKNPKTLSTQEVSGRPF